MKNVLKKKDNEISDYKKELLGANKALKEKEKATYKLQQKNDNQSENITRFKAEISTLKSENKKLLKKKPVKVLKSKNASTNTLPVTLCSSTCQPLIPNSWPTSLTSSTNKITSSTWTQNRIFTPNSILPIVMEGNNNIYPVPTTSCSP